MKKHLLYDGDFLRYSIGFANEQHGLYYGDDLVYKNSSVLLCKEYAKENGLPEEAVTLSKVAAPVGHCLAAVKRSIQYAMDATGAETLTVFLSGKGNFREKIARQKEYKGNRKNFVKPLLYNEITDYLISRYKAVVTVGYEADDAMAIYATHHQRNGNLGIIATADKDLNQVPCRIFNVQNDTVINVYDNPVGELYLKQQGSGAVLKGYGEMFFYAQMLTGDTVDNIPGCVGYGAQKAFGLSECTTVEQMQQFVEEAYAETYGTEKKELVDWAGNVYNANHQDRMLEQGKLLWMLREYPNKSGTHIWKPWF